MLLVVILLSLIAGCAQRPQAQPVVSPPVLLTETQALAAAPPDYPELTVTATLSVATPVPTATLTPPISHVASPLAGITLAELPAAVSNPFEMPLPGRDDAHHGSDFAFYRWKDRVGMEGWEIDSVLDGKAIAVITNSEVYGKFVIIETPIDRLPAAWDLSLPAYRPTVVPDSRVECPDLPKMKLDFNRQSLYLLYGHMQDIAGIKPGNLITAGQKLGSVGNTGRSGNPHLHLEMRLGPGNALFDGMSHYTAAATEEERANYCLWRVSDTFQLLDPMKVIILPTN